MNGINVNGPAMQAAVDPSHPGDTSGRVWLGRIAVIVGLQVVLAAGFWGLFVDRGGAPEAALASPGETVAIPSGQFRVEGVLPWTTQDHNMPGMQVPDAVPEGKRRVLVDVTLRATGGSPLAYRPDRFTVSDASGVRIPPYWSTEGLGAIAPGARATVTLVFDVPKGATGLVLRAEGGGRPVALEASSAPADPGVHEHDEGGAAGG